MTERRPDYDAVRAILKAYWTRQDAPAFRAAVDRLRLFAEAGDLEAAEYLAEILALSGPVHDAASAYKWYYIVLSEQGYSVEFADRNGTPPNYCGPDGDFRNEAMVSGLVEELGFLRVRELDNEATQWLSSRRPTTGCS
jgi:hypothetical protein